MERLTRKSLEYKDTWIADGSLSNIEGVVRGNAIDRLAEFEDFMEEVGAESLDELENCIVDLKQENQALKDFNSRLQNINIELLNQKQILLDRWQKLKLAVEDELAEDKRLFRYAEKKEDRSVRADYMIVEEFVLAKMQELEKE